MDLTACPTSLLERLRDAARRGDLGDPISADALLASGLGALAPLATTLSDLSKGAVVAIAEAALAERVRTSALRAELVWTGPEGRGSLSRDTAVVVQDLFRSATRSILIAGFRFDSGGMLLGELHRAMKEREVSCRVFGDSTDAHDFIKTNWPFGLPHPDVFAFVPQQGVHASLHAKCVVADMRRVFVTSANFTNRGHSRNIEVGVLIEDPLLAAAIERQFSSAEQHGAFIPVPTSVG